MTNIFDRAYYKKTIRRLVPGCNIDHRAIKEFVENPDYDPVKSPAPMVEAVGYIVTLFVKGLGKFEAKTTPRYPTPNDWELNRLYSIVYLRYQRAADEAKIRASLMPADKPKPASKPKQVASSSVEKTPEEEEAELEALLEAQSSQIKNISKKAAKKKAQEEAAAAAAEATKKELAQTLTGKQWTFFEDGKRWEYDEYYCAYVETKDDYVVGDT